MAKNLKFDFTHFGTTYKDCVFSTANYAENGNLAVIIENDLEGEIMRVTVNPGKALDPKSLICIKDYSENRGICNFLKIYGFIEREPVEVLSSGFVELPVYRLTDKGKEYMKI